MDTGQAEAFARDGYLVLRGAVPPPLLAALNAVVDRHVLAWWRGEMGYSLSAASLLVHRDLQDTHFGHPSPRPYTPVGGS